MKSRSYNQMHGQGRHAPPKKKEQRRRTWLDFLMGIATWVCVPLLLLSYLAPYINPNTLVWLALLGLVAPVFYLANIVLTLYWTMRWRAVLVVPLIALLAGIGGVSLFYRPMISKYYPEPSDHHSFRMMSYNVCGFLSWSDSLQRVQSTVSDVAGFIRGYNPDILCIQEFQGTPKAPVSMIDSLLGGYRYSVKDFRVGSSSEHGFGQAVYSRFPIVRSGSTHFENSLNSSIWADVVVNKDTVRVINNHLQTTTIKNSDYDFDTEEGMVEDAEKAGRKLKKIAGKLTVNYKIRAIQADTIALQIHNSPYPVIVCGDFNDTPVSYAYHTIRKGLKDSYCEKGHGMINTYRGFFNLFRIDYILYSPKLKALDYSSPPYDKSDHNPVITTFRFEYK